ncbi:beta-lactamase/transpeptidase-like protein [Trematosphaeria pertusa]|uniref:Beta-lactamase/transpeptidase-like protein n=1 Tax=Trematosphaeria pertusa TaxID=390896 RepID=A0A6A6I5L6_9PLEO|nr:beta-lactamase/transpeptidase-like protein [Trematosphaeria pertusa]KAF2245338.1 beta-lactamase/transpeptidase-like protein [Trematosphaeria pertusa]
MENGDFNLLEAEVPLIEDLRRLSGAVALSLGVFHHGRIIYTRHFGRRDVEIPDPPNDDTVYYLASVSKCIGVCALARLVSDGVLDWDTPIRKYLPTFERTEDEFGQQATLRDLACHRTGLPLANFWWGQMEGELLLNTAQLVQQACHLKTIAPFRSSFYYSAWNYFLIHAIVERVTGISFGEVVKTLLLNPLGLKNTTFDTPPATPNFALAHAARNDGTSSRIPMNSLDSSTGLGASMGGKGTMEDMLSFFSAFVSAYRYQKEHGVDSTPNTPFFQLRSVLQPQISVKEDSPSSYCMGIYRTKLPGVLSCASLNAPLLGQKLPIFGSNNPGTEIFHHTGNLPGCFGSYFLIPETQSGVVCLTNTTPLFDPTDFAAQIALGVLLRESKPDNLLALGKLAAKQQIGWYQNINKYLASKRTSVRPSVPLALYAGTYINRAANFKLVVTPTATGLRIAVQGSSKTFYDLEPLDGDTFFWPADRDRGLCRGMFPYPFSPLHTVKFWVRESWVDRLI